MNSLSRHYESVGPDGLRVRGTLLQIYERYQQLEKTSRGNGDESYITEGYSQYSDHCARLLNEMGAGRLHQNGSAAGQHRLPAHESLGSDDNMGADESTDGDASLDMSEEILDVSAPELDAEERGSARHHSSHTPRFSEHRSLEGRAGEGRSHRPRSQQEERFRHERSSGSHSSHHKAKDYREGAGGGLHRHARNASNNADTGTHRHTSATSDTLDSGLKGSHTPSSAKQEGAVQPSAMPSFLMPSSASSGASSASSPAAAAQVEAAGSVNDEATPKRRGRPALSRRPKATLSQEEGAPSSPNEE